MPNQKYFAGSDQCSEIFTRNTGAFRLVLVRKLNGFWREKIKLKFFKVLNIAKGRIWIGVSKLFRPGMDSNYFNPDSLLCHVLVYYWLMIKSLTVILLKFSYLGVPGIIYQQISS